MLTVFVFHDLKGESAIGNVRQPHWWGTRLEKLSDPSHGSNRQSVIKLRVRSGEETDMQGTSLAERLPALFHM